VKKRLDFASVLFNIVAVLIIGVFLQPLVGKLTAFAVMLVLFAIPFLGYWTKSVKRDAVLYAGLLKEIWLNEVRENFFGEYSHIKRSRDMSLFVENNVINLAEAGVNPNVLVNNITYPIATTDYNPTALALPLSYYDTENTRVRNVIKKQYAFDAVKEIVRQHKSTLAEKIAERITHSWAPNANGINTPVIAATGAVKTLTNRRRLTMSDITTMQRAFDLAKFPKKRVLVLCPDHVQDLLDEDRTLFKQFAELQDGKILPLYGFDVYMSQLTAKFTQAGAKIAFGATALPTDCYSSLVYCEDEVMRAEGTLDMFFQPKEINTGGRADEIGFQQYYTGLPIRIKGLGAIYSGV
jgi:hypothetical protein